MDCNTKQTPLDYPCCPAAHTATGLNQADVLHIFVEAKADLDAGVNSYLVSTPMQYVCVAGSCNSIAALLHHKMDMNGKDSIEISPLNVGQYEAATKTG